MIRPSERVDPAPAPAPAPDPAGATAPTKVVALAAGKAVGTGRERKEGSSARASLAFADDAVSDADDEGATNAGEGKVRVAALR